MQAPLRIFIAHNYSDFSYAANSKMLALQMAHLGHRVWFFSHSKPSTSDTHPNLVVLQWPEKRPTGWRSFFFVLKQIRRNKPNLVIAHAAALNVVAAASWLWGVNRRAGYYHSAFQSSIIDNHFNRLQCWMARKRKAIFYNMFTDMVAVSHFGAADLHKWFGYPDKRIKVIYNGLPNRQPTLELEKPTLPPLVFFAPGRLDPGKNMQKVVEGFRQYNEKSGGQSQLMIAGTGSEEQLIRKMTSNDRSITMLGQVPYEQIDALIRSAHFLVCSSLAENFGMVIVEAMMNGTPVLASAVGGIPELVNDKTGILVNGSDAIRWEKAFAQASAVVTNKNQYQSLQENGRAEYLEKFQQETHLQEMISFLLTNSSDQAHVLND